MPDEQRTFPSLTLDAGDAVVVETSGHARLAAWIDDPLTRLILRADGLDPQTVFEELAAVGRALAARPTAFPSRG